MGREKRKRLLDWIMNSESFAAGIELLDQAVANKIRGLERARADLAAAKVHVEAIDAEFEDVPSASPPHDDPVAELPEPEKKHGLPVHRARAHDKHGPVDP